MWHGLRREVNGQVIADYYNSANALDATRQSYKRVDGATVVLPPVPTPLIHAIAAGSSPSSGGPLTSYFGYVDPYFNPDSNGDGDLSDPADARTTTLPGRGPGCCG